MVPQPALVFVGLPPSDLPAYKMILTQCAVCATALGLTLGKKCGRCSTRYCGAECQVQHWQEGGHDKLCKTIKKAGGAEQYNANKKYSEAVAVAAEKCADDTKGQTCFICTQALHWKTKEGLVRGCSCRGTAGFAHVSCLAEQAKILFAEAEENNLGNKVRFERWTRWDKCSLCEQHYHGVVACALGWACWKTFVGRPEKDQIRRMATTVLGNGLQYARQHEDALSVREAELSMLRRIGGSQHAVLIVQGNIANSYNALGRSEETLRIKRDVYMGFLRLYGEEDKDALREAANYAVDLLHLQRFKEARSVLRKMVPVARRVLGDSHEVTMHMRWNYSDALSNADGATLDDLREALTTLEDAERIARRVFGGAHPLIAGIEVSLEIARASLPRRVPEVLQTADDLAARFRSL